MQKQEEIKPPIQSNQLSEVYNKIFTYLTSKNIPFEVIEHSATRTSAQSAQQRNTPLEWGSKTMLVSGKQSIFLLLYRAHQKISWSKLRKVAILGKKCRMCQQGEVKKLGVMPGGVPPFSKLLGVQGIVDARFRQQKTMAFNAGLLGKSIVMSTQHFPFEQMVEADITD